MNLTHVTGRVLCKITHLFFIFFLIAKVTQRNFMAQRKNLRRKKERKRLERAPPPRFICIDILTTTVTTRDIKIDYCL